MKFQLNIQSFISSASQQDGSIDVLTLVQFTAGVGALVALGELVEVAENVCDSEEVFCGRGPTNTSPMLADISGAIAKMSARRCILTKMVVEEKHAKF